MPPKSPRKNFKWTPAQVAKLKAAYAAGHNTGLEVQGFTGWDSKSKDTDPSAKQINGKLSSLFKLSKKEGGIQKKRGCVNYKSFQYFINFFQSCHSKGIT